MFLRTAAAVLIVVGTLSLIYGVYLYIDYYGGFVWMQDTAFMALDNLQLTFQQILSSPDFKEYTQVGTAVFFIIAGIILIWWGERLMKR